MGAGDAGVLGDDHSEGCRREHAHDHILAVHALIFHEGKETARHDAAAAGRRRSHDAPHGSVAAGYGKSPHHGAAHNIAGKAALGFCAVYIHFVAFAAGETARGLLIFLFAKLDRLNHDIDIMVHLCEDFFFRKAHISSLIGKDDFTDFFSFFFSSFHEGSNGIIT